MATCSACSAPARAKGLCTTHYQQQRRGGSGRPETALVALPGIRVHPVVAGALRDLATNRRESISATLRWILDERLLAP